MADVVLKVAENDIVQKAFMIALLAGGGYIAYQAWKCSNEEGSISACMFKNLSPGSLARDLAKDLVGGAIETAKDLGNEVAKTVTDVSQLVKSSIGRVPDLRCNADQEEHHSLCYNKSEIPKGDHWGSFRFTSAGRFAKDCATGQRDDGIACWVDASTKWDHDSEGGWSLNRIGKCEERWGGGNCESFGGFAYRKCSVMFGPDYYRTGGFTCQRDPMRRGKEVSWVTGRVKSQQCNDDETLYAGLCYKKEAGWEISAPGFAKRVNFDPCNPPDDLKNNQFVQSACQTGKPKTWEQIMSDTHKKK